ncbi:MAG: signal peptide peptidase SppA [Nitrospinota bacterium]|nr:MAG: signal peptide peptidase SppA [Nitrospinota bacterium]
MAGTSRNLWVIGLVTFGILGLSFFLFAFFLTLWEGKDTVWSEGKGRIGLIPITGPLIDARPIIKQLQRFSRDSSIKAIVLRIDSPGGGVVPSQELYREIRRTREQGKRVVASLGDVAASGGYYVAVAAETIFANPGTITGSIGVILHLSNVEALLEKVGLKFEVMKSGRYKDLGSPFRALDESERQILQALLEDVHAQFVEAVAEGRQLTVDRVRELADGRIFSGRQALELGLVDRLGSLRDAILATAKSVGIPGEPRVVRGEPERGLLWTLLRGDLSWETLLGNYLYSRRYQLQYLWY